MTSITLYNVLKSLHVLAAIVFVGGIVARQIVRGYAKRGDDVTRYALLTQAASSLENLMVKPGSLIILALGIWLARRGGLPMFGVLEGQSQNWLLVANILYVIGFSMVPLVFVPRGRRHKVVLDAALAQGRMTPELRVEMNDPVVKLAHRYEIASLVAIVLLMVLKPF